MATIYPLYPIYNHTYNENDNEDERPSLNKTVIILDLFFLFIKLYCDVLIIGISIHIPGFDRKTKNIQMKINCN